MNIENETTQQPDEGAPTEVTGETSRKLEILIAGFMEKAEAFPRDRARLKVAEAAYAPAAGKLQKTRNQINELEASRDKELASAKALKTEWSQQMRAGEGKVSEVVKEKLRDQRYAEELADEFNAMIEEAKIRERIERAHAMELAQSLYRASADASRTYALSQVNKALSESKPLARALKIASQMTKRFGQETDPSHTGWTIRQEANNLVQGGLIALEREMASADLIPAELVGVELGPISWQEIRSPIAMQRAKREAASLMLDQQAVEP